METTGIQRKPIATFARAALGCAFAVALSADGGRSTAAAAQECYGFEHLAPDVQYVVGDTIQAEHARIELQEFHGSGGNPSQSPNQYAIIFNGNIARGIDSPELRMYLINALVTPDAPLRRVRFRFAENVAALLANIAINGERHVVTGGLALAHQQVVSSATGDVRVTVTMDQPGAGNFQGGEVELEALSGAIDSFGLGGLQFFIDDVCMQR